MAPQGENDGTWLVSPQAAPTPVKGAPKGVSSLAWSPDGRRLALVAPAAVLPPAAGPPTDALFTATRQDNTLTGLQQLYVPASPYASPGPGIILAGWPPGGLPRLAEKKFRRLETGLPPLFVETKNETSHGKKPRRGRRFVFLPIHPVSPPPVLPPTGGSSAVSCPEGRISPAPAA